MPPLAPPPAADGLTAEEANGLGELLTQLVLGREPDLAGSVDTVRAIVRGACQRDDDVARRRGMAMVIKATAGLDKPPMVSVASGLVDLLDATFPDEESLERLLAELDLWVWWYRLPSYALVFACQMVTHRRHSRMHPVACLLYGQTQIALNEDLYLQSIENAYRPLTVASRQDGGEAFQEPARHAKSLLHACWQFYRTWSSDYSYEQCNPLAEHLYAELTLTRLDSAFPDLHVRQRAGEPAAMATIVAQCDGPELVYWRVVARRFLGLLHAGAGETEAALADFELALREAESAGLDTEIGHLRRLYGAQLGSVERFDQAEAMLTRAAGHELSALLFYWHALSAYELADVRRRSVQHRWATTKDPGLLTGTVRAYQSGRDLLSQHLTGGVVPIDRAVKVQQLRSYNDNALNVAFLAQAEDDILAQADFNGPRESAELLADVKAAASLTDQNDAAAFRQSIPSFQRHLGSAPADFEQYLTAVIDENASRQLYYRTLSSAAMMKQILQPSEVAARVRALRRPGQLLIVIEPGASGGTILLIDLESGNLAPYGCSLSRERVRTLHRTYTDAIAALAGHPKPWPHRDAAVKRLLAGYQESLGPWLNQLARFLDGRAITFLAGQQIAAVPLHALQAGGRTLAEICPVGYGQTLGGFLSLLERSPESSTSEVTMVYDDLGTPAFEPLAAAFPGGHARSATILRNPSLDQLVTAVQAPAADPTSARDLFFACHGTFRPEDPVASSLLLDRGNSAILLADVLARLDLSGWRSVVLGACETGQARSEIAAEYLGLASAFLAAGAAYVVGSLWKAHPLATSMLFERYFTHLDTEGQGPRQALRSAQTELIALTRDEVEAWITTRLPGVSAAHLTRDLEEQPFAGPAFWAAFSVNGAL